MDYNPHMVEIREAPEFTNWLAALKDRRGQVLVILLCGGDKRTQSKDIRKAIEVAEALED
jgi:putative component of toxin-antitoxin plasmid stabilization module